MWKYLLFILLSIPLIAQRTIWIDDIHGGKLPEYTAARDSFVAGTITKVDFSFFTPDTDGTIYTSREFSLNYWEGQLNSTLQIDSMAADTTGDDTLRLVAWLDIWDGVGWVANRIQWYTLSTSGNFTNDSLIVANDTLIFTSTSFNTNRYYFTTALVLNQSWIGFLDLYYTRIRWRLAFLETGSTWGHCYTKQSFQYWQKGR